MAFDSNFCTYNSTGLCLCASVKHYFWCFRFNFIFLILTNYFAFSYLQENTYFENSTFKLERNLVKAIKTKNPTCFQGDLVMASSRQVGQVKHKARKLLIVELSCMIILLGV